MFEITQVEKLNSTVTQMSFFAPAIAQKAKAGQFVVLRIDQQGERIPLTISSCDSATGQITLVFQVVGNTTRQLDLLQKGQHILDLVGPLGIPTHIDQEAKRVCVIGGGVGTAIAMPVAKAFFDKNISVDMITGFRNKDLIILSDNCLSCCDNLFVMTDDGSNGNKGFVTTKLAQLIEQGVKYDQVFAVGPVIMMKTVCDLTKKHSIKTVVSLNPIMIDGIGMCGGCRVTVGGKNKFACVDGPDFDGHEVDFEGLIMRNKMYDTPHKCNLTGEVR